MYRRCVYAETSDFDLIFWGLQIFVKYLKNSLSLDLSWKFINATVPVKRTQWRSPLFFSTSNLFLFLSTILPSVTHRWLINLRVNNFLWPSTDSILNQKYSRACNLISISIKINLNQFFFVISEIFVISFLALNILKKPHTLILITTRDNETLSRRLINSYWKESSKCEVYLFYFLLVHECINFRTQMIE